MTYILTFLGGAAYMLGAILVGQWLKDRQPKQPVDYDRQVREWGIRW